MNYTITNNARFNSLEIAFEGKPSEAVRDAIKALGFRWNRRTAMWYGFSTVETLRAAIEGADTTATQETTTATQKPQNKPQKLDKALVRELYEAQYSSEKTLAYHVDDVAAVAVLPAGDVVTVNKRRIETSFCFGESGYDMDDAIEAAEHARTSEAYFKRENMEHYTKQIADYEAILNGESTWHVLIINEFWNQKPGCVLRKPYFCRLGDVVEACGGSCYVEELPGRELTVNGYNGRIATAEEIRLILDATKAAAAAHEKKVDAYLKRYSTSKVHAWTYWRDA